MTTNTRRTTPMDVAIEMLNNSDLCDSMEWQANSISVESNVGMDALFTDDEMFGITEKELSLIDEMENHCLNADDDFAPFNAFNW